MGQWGWHCVTQGKRADAKLSWLAYHLHGLGKHPLTLSTEQNSGSLDVCPADLEPGFMLCARMRACVLAFFALGHAPACKRIHSSLP